MRQTKPTTELKARDPWGSHGDYVHVPDGVIVEVITVHQVDDTDITAVLLSDGTAVHATPGASWPIATDNEREAYEGRRRGERLANELVALAQAIRDAKVGVSVNPSRIYIDVHGDVGALATALDVAVEAGADYAVRKSGALQVDVTGDALVPAEPEPTAQELAPPPEWPPPVAASPCAVAARTEAAFRRAGGTGPDRTGCTYNADCPLHPWTEREEFAPSDGHRLTPPADALEFDRHGNGGAGA